MEIKDESQQQLDRLMSLMEAQEELLPELEAYLEEDGPFGACLRHPLVYSVFHTPMQNALVNESFRQKTAALAEALKNHRWNSYVYLHERPYRIDAFGVIEPLLADDEYWDLLGDIWTDSENIRQNEDEWRMYLSSDRPGHELMMSDEEREALAQDYPDVIPIFRGFHIRGRECGMSWTANRITAKWFARRLAQPEDTQYLASAFVKKEHVVAYFNGRSEQEMVVLPEHVYDMEIEEL